MKFFEKKEKYEKFSENFLKSVFNPAIMNILKISQVGVGGGQGRVVGGGGNAPLPPSGYGPVLTGLFSNLKHI